MKRIYTYILVLLSMCVACQRVDLPEEILAENPIGVVGKKVQVEFSTAELLNVETKAIIDPSVDIHTMHLVLFDENGMLVEVCEATLHADSDHDDHASGRFYTVTLTTTDKPRIVHFIANCPVDQIIYGHEASVIGNMYVDKNDSEHRTEYETSYWARIEVPYILVEEKTENDKIVTSLHNTIINKFRHVPLLRNYAEITVTNLDTDFEFEGYTIYNVIDRGTIAPYNQNLQPEPGFQNFIYTATDIDPETGAQTQTTAGYLYPQVTGAPHFYEGHFLASSQLITDLPENQDGTVRFFNSNEPFYIYERKVSVMTDEEHKWLESPPHIIIKGNFKEGNTSNTYYYKMDLVYKIKDPVTGLDTEIKYYNILRNFSYQFNLTKVHDAGYKTLEEAIAGAAGNNISGSTSASKLTNVSDNVGRLWVSYTDTTLVDNSAISLKYKYIPNYYDNTRNDYGQVQNQNVTFENVEGDVISGISVSQNDITSGTWKGYRDVTISINNPESTVLQQVLSLKTNSANLNRSIRYTLRQKFNMVVECTPRVAPSIEEPVEVDVKLPIGLTEDMFPLVLKMETLGKTISPDATKNSLPVEVGPSIINQEGIEGTNSFYYLLTIPTFADYSNKTTVDNRKIYTTHWLTGMANNASTVYVANKYFETNNDSWINVNYAFSDVRVVTENIPKGLDRDVSITFTKDASDNQQRQVTVTLDGMTYNGNTTFTVNVPANQNTYTVNGLKTTSVDGKVGFTLDAADYQLASAISGERVSNRFENVGFTQGSVALGAGNEVQYNFTVPVYYADMEINVTLDGLIPADDETRLESPADGRSAIKSYVFKPTAAGTYTLMLKTANKDASTCSLTLEAEKYYYETVHSTIEQTAAKYAFQSLTVPESVRYGAGRTVSIKFKLDGTDAGFKNKDVKITLVGMTRNGETSFTYNTGNVQNNREVTINNLVTTSDGGNLRVTVEAAEYLPITATISQRTPGEFKNVKFSKNSVGTDEGEKVELRFTIDNDSYYSGMVVNLVLGNLRPEDDNYTYTPRTAGDHTVTLVTYTADDEFCTAQLKAEGMVDSQVASVERSAEPQLTVIWENDTNTAVNWNGVYRFGLEGRDGGNECIETFSQEIWDIIKNGTFYIKFRPSNNNFNNFNMRITTGHWSRTWRGSDITSGSNLIKNNGDGTYYIQINFTGDQIVNNLDAQHLLFTGSGYTPIELYCYM